MFKNKNYWLISFIFTIGITFSLVLYFTLDKWERVDRQHAFQTQAQTITYSIETELKHFTTALSSIADFIQLSPNLTREQFRQVSTNHLNRYPGILAFSWNPMVLNEKRGDFINRLTRAGFTDADIKRASPNGQMITEQQQGYYFPVYYIEPLSRFRPILGFNLTSERIRHQAVKQAFNQKSMTATEKLLLVDQADKVTGVLLVLPIFENTNNAQTSVQRGVLLEAINLDTLFSQSLLEIYQNKFNLLVLDTSSTFEKSVLYRPTDVDIPDEEIRQLLTNEHANFVGTRTMNFANKRLKIVVLPKTKIIEFTLFSVAWIAYIGSLIFTFLVCHYWLKRHHSTLEAVVNARRYAIANKKLSDEIIERLKVEKKLVKFAHAFQLSADGINLLTTDGNYTYCNKASIELYGYQPDEMESLHYYDINQASEIQELNLLDLVKRQENWHGTYPQTRKDGTKFPASISLSLIKDETGNEIGVLEITRDMTEVTLIETQLQQAKKMEALGTLAGGIAHDFNNVLASILGNSEMIIMSNIDASKTRGYVGNIQESCARAADLVKQIMTFSRMETMQMTTIDLAKTVNDALILIRASLPANIHISCSIDSHCQPIKGDETQIHQILLNLCANASQAIGEAGGTIAIDLQQEFTLSHDNQKIAKDQVRLSITDTGNGISKDNLSKIFDPFFTTKKVGEGTGLGLAVVNSIIESHEGEVEVKSEPDQGTSFIITFPTCPSKRVDNVAAKPLSEPEEKRDPAQKHVLIVEDEPHISKLYREFINEYGYTTTVCEDGKQALDVFNADNHIDLVLTDQAMPHVTGKELSIILLKRNPKLPIIMCTGYSEVISEELAQEIGIKHYFLKPVSLTKLMDTIDNLLKE